MNFANQEFAQYDLSDSPTMKISAWFDARSNSDLTAGSIGVHWSPVLDDLDPSGGGKTPGGSAGGLEQVRPLLRGCSAGDLGWADRVIAGSRLQKLGDDRLQRTIGVANPRTPTGLRAVADGIPVSGPLLPPGEGSAAGHAGSTGKWGGHQAKPKRVSAASSATAAVGSRRMAPAAAMPLSIACSTRPPRHQSPHASRVRSRDAR